MTIKAIEDLKPCPFCGSSEHLFIEPDEVGSGGQWVSPVYAGCGQWRGCGVSRCGDDTPESIAAWNTRPSHADPLIRALEQAFDFLGGVDGASEIRAIILDALSNTQPSPAYSMEKNNGE